MNTSFSKISKKKIFEQLAFDSWLFPKKENATTFLEWFAYCFNQPIEFWDVRSVTDMSCMFLDSHEFNQSIGNWDVSNVEYMSMMFYCAESFIHPIGDWDVSSVIDLSKPFNEADSLRF